MLAEEVVAHEFAVVGFVGLVFTVDRLFHHLAQDAFLVAGKQRIPVTAPDQLDHVPAAAAEITLEFLDDLAVAAHRPVQALQVAVDDEHQVVELFARCQRDCPQGFGLIHLSVTAENPDFALAGVGDAAGVQIFEKACLINRHQRSQAHRHRGELPELRHQLWVRVRRQALAADFLAKVIELVFGEAALKVGAPVDARRGVTLKVDQIAAMVRGIGVPEVVLPAADHGGQRGERSNVPPEITAIGRIVAVGPNDHGHGVPADETADTLFKLHISRIRLLERRGNGIEVCRVR